ncbi:MAG: response regulator transcription factor [Elusimicrobia bacterium]|nr:response regulator transcription factor [Elusimicrobiota bacterium]
MAKLLIIDDDAHLRESLAEVLELEGFECSQAGTAHSGIEAAKKVDPDVVIMDIQLPDSSGFQICQTLRKRSRQTILIMMTGRFLSSEEKKQGFELGADEYITKPFDLAELSIRIKQLLSRRTPGG